MWSEILNYNFYNPSGYVLRSVIITILHQIDEQENNL